MDFGSSAIKCMNFDSAMCPLVKNIKKKNFLESSGNQSISLFLKNVAIFLLLTVRKSSPLHDYRTRVMIFSIVVFGSH